MKASFFSSMTANNNNNAIELPKLIHVIWVGPSLMPKDGLRFVSEWAKQNPSFEIWLWTDLQAFQLHSADSIELIKEQITEEYKNLFSKLFNVEVFWGSHNIEKKHTTAPVILKDINEQSLTSAMTSYEIYRLDPNYGAASDKLRYEILNKFGGLYFDCRDIGPGATSLEKSGLFGPREKHALYIDHRPQELHLTENDLKMFDFKFVNGDVLLSTPGNPLINLLCRAVEANYTFDQNTLIDEVIERTYGSAHIYYLTLKTTAGTLIHSKLIKNITPISEENNIVRYLKKLGTHEIEILPLRCLKYSLVNPGENKLSWLYKSVTRLDKDKALSLIEKTIRFDVNNFKILRLDDYVSLIAQSLEIDLEKAANILMPLLSEKFEFAANNLLGVQCTYSTKTISNFCKMNNLVVKNHFSLEEDICAKVIYFSTNYKFLKEEIWERLCHDDANAFFSENFSKEQVAMLANSLIQDVSLIKILYNRLDKNLIRSEIILNNLKLCNSSLQLHIAIMKKIDEANNNTEHSIIIKEWQGLSKDVDTQIDICQTQVMLDSLTMKPS